MTYFPFLIVHFEQDLRHWLAYIGPVLICCYDEPMQGIRIALYNTCILCKKLRELIHRLKIKFAIKY